MHVDAADDSTVPQEDDLAKWNIFVNDFAKHLGFFRLKMAEAYSLPISVVESICSDMQTIFDTYQLHLVEMVTNRLKLLNVRWNDDLLLNETLSILCMKNATVDSKQITCFPSILYRI
jgi:hypothetical protein